MTKLLNGKVAIVTGGGRGLGRAHALRLAEEGAAVLVNDLGGEMNGEGSENRQPAEAVAAEIRSKGGHAAADSHDISDWTQAGAIVDAAVKEFGRLDIVVNNAGIGRFSTIDTLTRMDWERTIAVNLTGTAALCHWAAAHWRSKGAEAGRAIVNTTSGMGLTPVPGNPSYAASKAGVAAVTITSAMELADLGVRVNAIAPVARTRVSEVVAGEHMKPPEKGFDAMAPENVAVVVAYLASPLCAFTGRIFGIIGDSLTVFDGWSVTQDFLNDERRWTLDQLHTVLAGVTPQQKGAMQGLRGRAPLVSPPDQVLQALAAIEKRA